jgi:hypothetical protein
VPEIILTALVLDRTCPGFLSGQEIISARESVEDMVLALARTTGTSLEDIRKMPLWQVLRYLKKLAKQTKNE